eukprot:14005046-Alexandrium_andersonii.AAC.1
MVAEFASSVALLANPDSQAEPRQSLARNKLGNGQTFASKALHVVLCGVLARAPWAVLGLRA